MQAPPSATTLLLAAGASHTLMLPTTLVAQDDDCRGQLSCRLSWVGTKAALAFHRDQN